MGHISTVRQATIKSQDTRKRILGAAETLFARHGYDGTRVDQIARHAGIRRASLFYYYEDKSQIYDAVLTTLSEPLIGRIAAVVAAGSGIDRIEAGITAYFDFLIEHPGFARMLLRELANYGVGELAPLSRQLAPLIDAVVQLLRESAAAGICNPIDPHHLMAAVSGATLFFVVAAPLFGVGQVVEEMDHRQQARHRAAVLDLVRRLVDVKGAR
jgi:TetR/AcrR family transcriptional regulator